MSRPGAALLAAALLAAALLACACGTPPRPADLVLVNGKIVTLDGARPTVRALAARDGRVVRVGDDGEVRALVGPGTRVIDLEGHLALPGFIEGHAHFEGLGRSLMTLDLRGARSWDDVVDLVARAATATSPGSWIRGRGWHQEKWDVRPAPEVQGYPTHARLSEAVPDRPVLLEHAAGSHGGIVNHKAMERIGLGRDTPDPPGGEIVRDAARNPTGMLREHAFDLAERAYEEDQAARGPAALEAEARRAIELADHTCLANGITSFQDAGSTFPVVDRLREAVLAGGLGVRLWVMLDGADVESLARRLDDYRIERLADAHLTVRAIKRYIDGALGTHSAWLLEPYADLPGSSGFASQPLDETERVAKLALEHGFQLAVHAIGDRGNREALDLYDRVFAAQGGGADRRWRIEHAQHLNPQEIPRFARSGVIASMQAVHCTSDGPWVPLRLGEARAAEGAYVWRKLIDAGAVVTNGTDAPVEDVSPIASFYAAVTRRMADGTVFHGEQCMTRDEALRSMTLQAAYAAFEEDIKGSLSPGKLADITVLSRDILTVAEERIPGTEVLYTIVGGRVIYER